jgi:hypothetical protein
LAESACEILANTYQVSGRYEKISGMTVQYPDPFLEVRVDLVDLGPPLRALCAGYEAGDWRSVRLADHLFGWVPYVALIQEYQLSFASHNFVELLKVAAAHIYNTKKTANRGELGEILLHLACVLHFECEPILCKLALKSSSNDTVKGFDGVHVRLDGEAFEIWLGESKFYTDGKEAVRDAIKSVQEHILAHFLVSEKAMLFAHVGQDVPKRDQIVKLFKSSTSIDDLLKVTVFPVVITYESQAIASHDAVCEQYVNMITAEAKALKEYFGERAAGLSIRFQLILVPLGNKEAVVNSFDEKLKPFLK